MNEGFSSLLRLFFRNFSIGKGVKMIYRHLFDRKTFEAPYAAGVKLSAHDRRAAGRSHRAGRRGQPADCLTAARTSRGKLTAIPADGKTRVFTANAPWRCF